MINHNYLLFPIVKDFFFREILIAKDKQDKEAVGCLCSKELFFFGLSGCGCARNLVDTSFEILSTYPIKSRKKKN